jgi:Na+-transporting NADH:ubiquinone oxidoreductase subunit C
MSSAEAVLVDLKTGQQVEGDALAFDQQKAKKDPSRSFDAPSNRSRIRRLPDRAVVYQFFDDEGALDTIVLPIEGYGLWGTLYGYLALEEDGNTVVGITYYDHKETPGLGGEVDNANWKSKWPGREVYDDDGEPALAVVKGSAPPASEDPFKVDGLSGATLTSRGVTNMIDFWLGGEAFGPYLDQIRTERRAA